jgi:hypothetical protein
VRRRLLNRVTALSLLPCVAVAALTAPNGDSKDLLVAASRSQ